MSVHQPQASALYHLNEVSTIETLEANFLRTTVIFPEDEMPVADRWFRILEYLPGVRGKHLYDDLTDVYAQIYKTGTGSLVSACIDFLLLRHRFFEMLIENRVGRAHQNKYEIEVCTVWRDKLIDRIDETQAPRIKRGRYIPAKAEAPTSHKWIQ